MSNNKKTTLTPGNWLKARMAAVLAAVAIAAPVGAVATACDMPDGDGSDGTSQTTLPEDLAQLNQDSNLVQGKQGCITALQNDPTNPKSLQEATQICDDMIAQARTQPNSQNNNDDNLMWFMLGANMAPTMYYGNPAFGPLNMWYDQYAWYPRGYGGFYNRIGSRTTYNTYIQSTPTPRTLSQTQSTYLRAAPSARPGVASDVIAKNPGTKTVTITTKSGAGTGSSTSSGKSGSTGSSNSTSRGGLGGPGISSGG